MTIQSSRTLCFHDLERSYDWARIKKNAFAAQSYKLRRRKTHVMRAVAKFWALNTSATCDTYTPQYLQSTGSDFF